MVEWKELPRMGKHCCLLVRAEQALVWWQRWYMHKALTCGRMNKAYVIDAIRTPIGKYGGGLSSIRPDDLLAHVVRQILSRHPGIDPARIEDLIAGDANQAGEDN